MILPGILLVPLMLYAAVCIVFYLHEVGHLPRRIRFKFKFPLPEAWSQSTSNPYGGLIVNALIFILVVFYLKEITGIPSEWMFFIQIIGLVSWIHFVLYTILGSFNYEPKIPDSWWTDRGPLGAYIRGHIYLDDVPNELAIIFVPIGLAAFWFFKEYYWQVIIQLIQLLWTV